MRRDHQRERLSFLDNCFSSSLFLFKDCVIGQMSYIYFVIQGIMKLFSFVLIFTVYTSSGLKAQSMLEKTQIESTNKAYALAIHALAYDTKRIAINNVSDSVWTDTTRLTRAYCDRQKSYIRENETKSIQANAHDRARRNAGMANLERVLHALFDYCLTEVAAGKTITQYCDANDFPCPPLGLYKK
ncbi:hypothetical protein [Spirosoma aerolatum]|uniref:hypothetical protein n=1 Tax=Spirosoma aerolatum TaxID=1211326 RepID=UPI0009AC9639|nr:hypothetical protein [Spirosoma aerolatum]